MKHLARALLLGFTGAFAQGQTAAPPATTTLKAQARLVVIDVVVAGKGHAAVHGLKEADFVVLDKGVPQKLRFFEEHTRPAADTVPLPAPKLPAGTFTNYASAPTDSTLSVLLLDTLNTPLSDQNYYNARVRAFLAEVRPGSAVAIFSLGETLHLLQGFTTDTAALRAALDKPRSRSSLLLDSPADGVARTEGVDSLIEMEADAGRLTDNLVALAAEAKALELKTRVLLSVQELSTLAGYLSGIPGRKNMVWATGGFPLSISPIASGAGTDAFEEVKGFETDFRSAIKLLAQSHTSVYTIEPQGLSAPPSGDIRGDFRNVAAATKADGDAFTAQAEVHVMMNMISNDTGGRAFYQTNAVGEATREALEEGSTYYTLAFVPAAFDSKQDFHPLTVKLTREGYELRYRHGYYPEAVVAAQPATAAVSPEIASIRLRAVALNAAMGHGLPASAQIVYKVRILPATTGTEDLAAPGNVPTRTGAAAIKPPYRRLLVDFAASPRDLTFSRAEDGSYTAHLRFVTLLYLPDGRLANRVSNAINTTLTPAGYAALLQTGFTYRQEISLPARGEYSLRTGVQDMSSGRIGTVECDASALRKLPPVAAAAQ